MRFPARYSREYACATSMSMCCFVCSGSGVHRKALMCYLPGIHGAWPPWVVLAWLQDPFTNSAVRKWAEAARFWLCSLRVSTLLLRPVRLAEPWVGAFFL